MPRRVDVNPKTLSEAVAVSSESRPRRVQDLLNDSAVSHIYEQYASNVHDERAASPDSTESVSSGDATNASEKKYRYLREQDRCDIIQRIASGEKQADLAREFGVTRAAICHIKKRRTEILSRSIHRDARHPKRARFQAISKPLTTALGNDDSRSQLAVVYEVRSSPMAILLTKLRDRETGPQNFRLFADRAIRLLLEEALACVDTRSIELVTPDDCACEGIEAIQTSCGIAVGESASPMLELFSAMYPGSPTGYVSGPSESETPNQLPTLSESDMQLPPSLGSHAVFLLMPTCSSGEMVCATVQTLLDHGAQEACMIFVCIVVSADATSHICQSHPAIRIVTAAVDLNVSNTFVCPGIGDFGSRYSNCFTMI